jgi:hypothetical protein
MVMGLEYIPNSSELRLSYVSSHVGMRRHCVRSKLSGRVHISQSGRVIIVHMRNVNVCCSGFGGKGVDQGYES